MRTPTSATGYSEQRRRQPAFTLIEILVVLVLLVVAAGLIVPRMGSSIGQQELREAAGRFACTARTARELAVSTQMTCAIEIDLDRGAYAVAIQSNRIPDGRMRVIQASWLKGGRWPETVRIKEYRTPNGRRTTRGTQRLEFFPDGTSSGALIRLASDSREYGVVVHSYNGRVVLSDAQASFFVPEQYDLGD